MTKVKVCGITNLEDARIACECDVDMLGFNFYPKSPRFVSVDIVKDIIDEVPSGVRKVGVFVNEEIHRIVEIADMVKLDAIQLHGDETSTMAEELKARTGCIIIKAYRISNEESADDVINYPADEILLDAFSQTEFGGTGETFEWQIAADLAGSVQLILAGGLSAENVTDAIERVHPYAVDACSRIESSPGKKDHDKMRAFIEEARK